MSTSTTERLTQNFQSILDGRGHKVSGQYLGNRKIGISGKPADVAGAVAEVGQIFDVTMHETLTEDKAVAVFLAPSDATAAARAAAALLNLALKKRGA